LEYSFNSGFGEELYHGRSETFLTTVFVMVDAFCQSQLQLEVRPGPWVSLRRSKVVTLRGSGPWACFRGERAFYRYAHQYLRAAFPTLPHRGQFDRLLRRYYAIIHTSDLNRERPHDLTGFQARLATKMTLHNFCLWVNEQVGRPSLAFADLVN